MLAPGSVGGCLFEGVPSGSRPSGIQGIRVFAELIDVGALVGFLGGRVDLDGIRTLDTMLLTRGVTDVSDGTVIDRLCCLNQTDLCRIDTVIGLEFEFDVSAAFGARRDQIVGGCLPFPTE